jgi:hypothetical protein
LILQRRQSLAQLRVVRRLSTHRWSPRMVSLLV